MRIKEYEYLVAQCNIVGENMKRKNIYLGLFPLNKPFQAFYAYKVFKEDAMML